MCYHLHHIIIILVYDDNIYVLLTEQNVSGPVLNYRYTIHKVQQTCEYSRGSENFSQNARRVTLNASACPCGKMKTGVENSTE